VADPANKGGSQSGSATNSLTPGDYPLERALRRHKYHCGRIHWEGVQCPSCTPVLHPRPTKGTTPGCEGKETWMSYMHLNTTAGSVACDGGIAEPKSSS
jgi:hypothetical protein